jgi:hypothetical protein
MDYCVKTFIKLHIPSILLNTDQFIYWWWVENSGYIALYQELRVFSIFTSKYYSYLSLTCFLLLFSTSVLLVIWQDTLKFHDIPLPSVFIIPRFKCVQKGAATFLRHFEYLVIFPKCDLILKHTTTLWTSRIYSLGVWTD